MSTLKTSLMLAGILAASSGYAQTSTATPAPSTAETRAGATITKEQARTAHDRIEQTAKADKKACEGMKANAEDICEAEAKAKEKVAKAELKYQQSRSEGDRVDLAETKAEARYEVAKEKCEDQQGDAQSSCKKAAKDAEQAARDQAKNTAARN